jgi:hypothetical protein
MSYGQLIEDMEYVAVYDCGETWVVEDKVLSQLPVIARTSTKTFYRIEFDVVELEDGSHAFSRLYFPKAVPRQVILRTAKMLNEQWARKVKEAESVAKLLGKVSEASSEVVELGSESYEDVWRRIQEYLR